MLTKEQIDNYLKNPNSCPYCGAQNIEASNWDGDTATEEVECKDCNKNWYDCYELVGMEEQE